MFPQQFARNIIENCTLFFSSRAFRETTLTDDSIVDSLIIARERLAHLMTNCCKSIGCYLMYLCVMAFG